MLYMGSIEALLYIFYGILIALQCDKKKKKIALQYLLHLIFLLVVYNGNKISIFKGYYIL